MSVPTTNLVLWLEADVGLFKDTAGTTPATADGDAVALWKDQSGGGHDVQQATSGNRPTLKTSIVNGKPVMRFVKVSSQAMATAASIAHGIGTGDLWFAIVYAPSTLVNDSTALSFGSFAPAFYLPASPVSPQPSFYLGGQHGFSASTIAASTWYLTEIGRISGTVKCWHSSGGATPALDATTFSVATSIANAILYVGNDNTSDYFSGDIAELLLYSQSLNATDQAALEQYLRAKYWGISFGSGNPAALLPAM